MRVPNCVIRRFSPETVFSFMSKLANRHYGEKLQYCTFEGEDNLEEKLQYYSDCPGVIVVYDPRHLWKGHTRTIWYVDFLCRL